MMHRRSVVIPDVFADPHVPKDAYRATFVRRMLMVPIGVPEPVAAIGAYWAETGQIGDDQVALLETLARGASTALENGRLFGALERLNSELEQRVTERTEELTRAQEALRQTQQMEVIGQLTGNVAHDFNNLLSPIMSSLDLVLLGRSSPEAIARSATAAMEAAEIAKTLVQRLLAFARRQPLIATAVDLESLVESMRGLLGSTLGPQVELAFDIAPGLPAARADKHQLEMAILNLAVNARDAMTIGGRLDIHVDRPPAPLPDRLAPGDYVRVVVRDNGGGMDAKTLRSATKPFFTTKEVGHGTGLGLSMVDGLTVQLGGALEISSQPNVGTEVRLFLPVAKAAVTSVQEEAALTGEEVKREGDLLLVDDEPLVRMGTNNMLTDLGYHVTEAPDAQKALALIDEGFHPDIVITDHVMPGMTGAEFALRLRADHPDIAIMIISGYQGIDLIAPDIVRLSKPFRMAHLEASLAAAKDQVKGSIH
jgi:signal transduction histidine kinase/CheY-like chemotaxis protein